MVKWYDWLRINKLCESVINVKNIDDIVSKKYSKNECEFSIYKIIANSINQEQYNRGIEIEAENFQYRILIDGIHVFTYSKFHGYRFIHKQPKEVKMEVISILKEYHHVWKSFKYKQKSVETDFKIDKKNIR